MKRAVGVVILSALVLTGCGTVRESRYNPMNWFGRGVAEPVAAEETVNPLIPRRRASIFQASQEAAYDGQPIAEVSQLLVERRPGGAVIRATGVANRQGPYEVRLVRDEAATDEDTLTYVMRAYQQPGPVGSERSRRVTAAVWLTDNDLLGIRTIRVVGASNAQVSRR